MAQKQTTITDAEFGDIAIRRIRTSRHIRIKIHPSGNLTATLPERAALRHVHELLESSRVSLRDTILSLKARRLHFTNHQHIGSSHQIFVQQGSVLTVKVRSPHIVVSLPPRLALGDETVQAAIGSVVQKTLRIEAKAYLPRRLSYLAQLCGCKYTSLRFSSAGTRWGSCSSNGTISLNVWLMQLPHALIDYVVIHELCHTVAMNHSRDFWDMVARFDPDFHAHRTALKDYHPSI